MEKIITQVKKTICNLRVEEISGTRFAKWFMTVKEITNDVAKVMEYAGITDIQILQEHNTVELPSSCFYCKNTYGNKGRIAAITFEDLEEVKKGKKHITEAITSVSSDNINDEQYMFVIWNSGSYKILDLNETFIPLPIHIGYMDGMLSNEYYKLKSALQDIKKNPYVLNPENVEIVDIPYYNADTYNTRSIEFDILLPVEVYSEYQKYDTFHVTSKIVNEFLGLAKYKKDPPDEDE